MVFAVNDDGASPDNSNHPVVEIKVRIVVPEEFVGASQHELIARQGMITGMQAQEQNVVIQGVLPAGEYGGLVEMIVAGTQGRGWMELAES
jgi:translation elongation factor EF-G